MKSNVLPGALSVLRDLVSAAWPRGMAGLVLEITDLCLALLLKVAGYVRTGQDPRLAAAHAQRVEAIYRWSLREQLQVMVDCESTGAHALDDTELQAITGHRVDFGSEPALATGRGCYQDTSEFIAAWLGIDYFEAKRRLADSRLLVARRNMDGSTGTPRFAGLAKLHGQSPAVDPRLVARTARQLDKLEPEDTTFDGIPVQPSARHRDGQLLEDHAVTILSTTDQRTATKKMGQLLTGYRTDNNLVAIPETGIYPRGTKNGVDEYVVRVAGVQAEQVRSLLAQADNPRTQAGSAARKPEQSIQPPLPDLFTSTDPAPDWAQPPDDSAPAPVPAQSSQAGPVRDSTMQDTGGNAGQAHSDQTGNPANQPAESAAETEVELLPGLQVSVPQRRLNAFMAALARPSGKGTAKTITPLVTVRLVIDDLQDLASARGVTAHGVELDPGQMRQQLCEADILPIVFNGKGQVIDAGATQRLFSPLQRQLALARDGGCIVPGCTVPPELVECHHCTWWQRGGKTDIGNCACLCKGHHALVHQGLITIRIIDGLPYAILPRHLDPEQIPRRNSYWV
ncbi:hypothetical protein OK351_12070 [Glutamicibacter sp. MNS18]|uniref:HNH endonuclease signature motif containing protein n=1 Tax=Glutamicibacter sp. MNS18 TaxID=2989817 RepID=UPI0022362568|nr:HNH endonuclease signature motif containing protein [Glutamicibacter sp. MNS18]MCW4466234.1 hypothetical protein [Glutamicibacter sp. MNS18]